MDLEKLIFLVREQDVLYNFNNRHYSDANERERIWRNIAQKLNESAKKCKKQWNCLRDGYRKNKRKKMTKSGQSSTPLKRWKFEEEMSFLDPYIQDRKTISSIEISETEADPEIDRKDILQNEDGAASTEYATRKRRNKGKNSASAIVVDHLLKSKEEEKDEVDAFFYGLAQTVKKMPPYYRAMTKARVGSVVGEMEIQSIVNPNPPIMARTSDGQKYSNVSTPMTSPDAQ